MTAAPLNVFLVDEDPVFRLGLRIWLDQRSEFQVIGEAADAATTLQQLTTLQNAATTTAADAAATATPAVDIVVLDIGLGQGDPDGVPGLQLCGDIKRQFPQLAVLVLSAQAAPVLQAAATQMGADGFGARGLPVRDLARLMQQVAAGQALQPDVAQDVLLPPQPDSPTQALRKSSLRQIEAEMAQIEAAAARRLPYWYRLVLAGKYRELKAARWLIQQMFPLPQPDIPRTGAIDRSVPPAVAPNAATGGAIAPVIAPVPVVMGDVRSRVCEAVFRKLQFPLDNRSDIPLEIDILRSEKARELLYTTLRMFETLLDDLQQAQVLPGQLVEKAPGVLRDLWEAVLTDFFGRYYTPPVDGLEQPLVAVLQQDLLTIQTTMLDRIPDVPRLLHHLLFQASLEIDGETYIATAPEALRRSQFLLENLLIQVACAVMQPVLNRYPDVEFLKRTLYQRRIISTRDITRFRNDLSWRYRWDSLVNDPKAIFESQYRLFALTPQGIRTHQIYAPRQDELASLSGVQYVLTLALEARDAIAPRLRSAFSLVGSSVVFVLTEVVGRGIGLIGRGIVKGVGSAWQENRFRQRQRDET